MKGHPVHGWSNCFPAARVIGRAAMLCGLGLAGAACFAAEEAAEVVVDAHNFWQARPEMTIGDLAPALFAEHWYQDGEKRSAAPIAFEPGKVYVVEHWKADGEAFAAALPNLARLHKEYTDQGVAFIGIMREPLEKVQELLDRVTSKDGGETYARQLTPFYLAVTPLNWNAPELSRSYGDSLKFNFVPFDAMIVGKEGKIEWIGKYEELKEPLQQVVDGTWDRSPCREATLALQRFSMARDTIMGQGHTGELAKANAMLDGLAGGAPKVRDWDQKIESVRLSLDIMAFGKAYEANDNEKAVAIFSDVIARSVDFSDPSAFSTVGDSKTILFGLIYGLIGDARDNPAKLSPELRDLALAALQAEFDKEPSGGNFWLCRMRAPLFQHAGDVDRAIQDQLCYAGSLKLMADRGHLPGALSDLEKYRALKRKQTQGP